MQADRGQSGLQYNLGKIFARCKHVLRGKLSAFWLQLVARTVESRLQSLLLQRGLYGSRLDHLGRTFEGKGSRGFFTIDLLLVRVLGARRRRARSVARKIAACGEGPLQRLPSFAAQRVPCFPRNHLLSVHEHSKGLFGARARDDFTTEDPSSYDINTSSVHLL